MIEHLVSVTTRRPSGAGRQCRAFLCVRDEAERLPYVLSYYRDLGVHWFIIVDNGSTDGTLHFLGQQPDCIVFTTHHPYAAANFGMDWINALIAEFGIGHWCLFVDADELLVYPQVEEIQLPQFCRYLEQHGREGLYTFMLDMYSPGPVAEAAYEAGTPFLEVCPLHDVSYRRRPRLSIPLAAPRFPPHETIGGPRLRRFYPEFVSLGRLGYALPRGLTALRNGRVGRALRLQDWMQPQPSPPLLFKVPLMFGVSGRYYVSSHRTTPLRLAPVTGALLHFKFFADFHQRVVRAIEEGQHFDGGTEYGRYAAALTEEPQLSFAHPDSQRYRSSEELLASGLLRTATDYEQFRARVRRTSAPVLREAGTVPAGSD